CCPDTGQMRRNVVGIPVDPCHYPLLITATSCAVRRENPKRRGGSSITYCSPPQSIRAPGPDGRCRAITSNPCFAPYALPLSDSAASGEQYPRPSSGSPMPGWVPPYPSSPATDG